MDYEGVIIEESLKDNSVLRAVKIVQTKTEPVTEQHKTPWLVHWTLHTVTVPDAKATMVAQWLSESLGDSYWYADFKNDTTHYIVFPGKVFKVNRTKAEEYQAATRYGLTLNIPDYQLDFAPNVAQWEQPAEP